MHIEDPGTLLYQDRVTMMEDPVQPTTVSGLARDLFIHGRNVMITLEPGDGTRYDLALIPLDNIDGSFTGIRDNDHANWLLVAYIQRNTSLIIPAWQSSHSFDFLTNNPWSITFLAWWFAKLRFVSQEYR